MSPRLLLCRLCRLSGENDWLNYGHQAPGVVRKIFAAPIAVADLRLPLPDPGHPVLRHGGGTVVRPRKGVDQHTPSAPHAEMKYTVPGSISE